MSADRVRVAAPAKVNLFLEVLGRRPDGYHELDTTMLAVDLADDLVMRRTTRAPGEAALALSGAGPAWSADVPVDERNLAWRAAALLLSAARERGHAGADTRLELRLEKRVPSGAGLGGGSSDAAAAHLAAAHLLELDPDDELLARGLAGLGADCAFFLRARADGAARCRGIGERVEPCAPATCLPPGRGEALALVAPRLAVSTPDVYRALALPAEPRRRAPGVLFNRLEATACGLDARLAAWRECLSEIAPERFLLSGSGSSFFALCTDEDEARALLREVRVRGKARDLGLRGEWVVRPMRAGAHFLAS